MTPSALHHLLPTADELAEALRGLLTDTVEDAEALRGLVLTDPSIQTAIRELRMSYHRNQCAMIDSAFAAGLRMGLRLVDARVAAAIDARLVKATT